MANRLESNLATLRQRLPPRLLKPTVGIVCGSGLSTLANSLRDVVIVPYADLEGFGTSTGAIYLISNFYLEAHLTESCEPIVLGHKSELAFGFVGEGEGVPVVAMLGRVSHLKQSPQSLSNDGTSARSTACIF